MITQSVSSEIVQVPVEEDVVRTNAQKCAACCKKLTAFLFSTVGLSCLMVSYTILGGFIFRKLEAAQEVNKKDSMVLERFKHVKQLWRLNEEMNVFHEYNWTFRANQILQSYERKVFLATKKDGWGGTDDGEDVQWTFAGAMLYSITVVTTIGRSPSPTHTETLTLLAAFNITQTMYMCMT